MAEVLARLTTNTRATFKPFAGDDHRAQLAALKSLAGVLERKISVERIVRVACPARGTLLASKRLDAYLSVFKWALELGGMPVLRSSSICSARSRSRRTDPETTARSRGADAGQPARRSGCTRPTSRSAGDLRVVAGDLEGDSVMSWLKTLLADAFYWTDNDLVVQTRSMYGGAPRAEQRDVRARSRRQGFTLQLLPQRSHAPAPSSTR